jgi:DNA polymerase/3'-5' exonuclease PolX
LFLEFKKLIKIYDHIYKTTNDPKRKITYKHKIISLKNSAKQIEVFPDSITNSTQISELPGIGKGTIARVDEFLKNHKFLEIDDFCNQYDCETILYNKPNIIYDDLITIFGIGDKLAKKLISEYKITSVKELQKLVKENKILLPDNVKTGLKYFGKIKNNIPRSEITQIREFIYDIFDKLDTNIVFDICGSFRRKKLTSNDIDVLITSYDIQSIEDTNKIMKKIIHALYEHTFLIESLTDEESQTRFMGFCKYLQNPIRKIDIRIVPIQSFFPAYLYFTGSYEFNERMRGIAKRQGYKLNEYGLYKNEKIIQLYSEKDVFDILGMKYLEPQERI